VGDYAEFGDKWPMAGEAVENFIQEDIFADILPPMSNQSAKISRLPRILSPRAQEKFERDELLARLPEFRVIRSSRRKRSIQALRQNGLIEIHIPDRLTRRQEFEIIPEMIELVLKREGKARKSDASLATHAQQLLQELLPDFHERPASLAWRSMRERWGSCTTVDRTIRISDRLSQAPEYVIRYVLFHELIHLRISGHGDDFNEYLARHPDKSRAEAFLEGYEAGASGFSLESIELPPD
jgi:predicted metal-dependent hydrolase